MAIANICVYNRVRDWLYGVRNTEPEPADAVEAQTESERLRVINHMIIVPQEEGGAGITPKHGEWKNVLAIFPLHDVEGNRRRMNEWNKKTFLSSEDLEHIRSNFGESVCHSLVWWIVTDGLGWVLLRFPSRIFSVPCHSLRVWVLVLVAARVVFDYLYGLHRSLERGFYRVLEEPGGRPELSLADHGCFGCAAEETRV